MQWDALKKAGSKMDITTEWGNSEEEFTVWTFEEFDQIVSDKYSFLWEEYNPREIWDELLTLGYVHKAPIHFYYGD